MARKKKDVMTDEEWDAWVKSAEEFYDSGSQYYDDWVFGKLKNNDYTGGLFSGKFDEDDD